MSVKVLIRVLVFLTPLLLWACEDSGDCPCSADTVDPPMSDLSVTWDSGHMSANLMPIVPPDPVACSAWLILENKNPQEAFSKLEIPAADVILAKNDSILGTMQMETDWDGILAPGQIDTILFIKSAGTLRVIDPPCDDQVLIEFMIQNADSATMVFVSDTLTVGCVY